MSITLYSAHAMKITKASAKLAEAVKSVRGLPQHVASRDSRVVDLFKDWTRQVKEAISRDEWYDRSGRHYLLSLAEAHQSQRCNNFKIQVYITMEVKIVATNATKQMK